MQGNTEDRVLSSMITLGMTPKDCLKRTSQSVPLFLKDGIKIYSIFFILITFIFLSLSRNISP